MNKETLKKGTRIYYGGDMANDEGFGTITSQTTDKFGTFVGIKMDDGREMNGPRWDEMGYKRGLGKIQK